jgi:hypothetical protein
MAALAWAEGQAERAARLISTAGSVRERLGTPVPPIYRAEQEALVAAVRAALGEDTFVAASEVGRTMTWQEAVAYALGKAGL